ncbi:hypothetical protein HA45_12555 [Pantoea rodasii]|nr:LysR family transcriptional regulator [Pantoea rodasii]ORM63947.1 hypothetical protein HA45_12555 [Pantoea rodasii]
MQLYTDEAKAFRRGRGDNSVAVNHHYGIKKARLQPQAIVLVPKVPRFIKPLNLPGAPGELTLRRGQITIGGVGAQLLQRNTRIISLTYEGERFFSHALRILEEIDHIQNAMLASTESAVGRLKISVAPIPNWFSERFNAFLAEHRKIEVELDISDRFVDQL